MNIHVHDELIYRRFGEAQAARNYTPLPRKGSTNWGLIGAGVVNFAIWGGIAAFLWSVF